MREVLGGIHFVMVVEDLEGGGLGLGEKDLPMYLVGVDQVKLEEFSVDLEKVITSSLKSKIQELAGKVGDLGADPNGL